MNRTCKSCVHRIEADCQHPQAANLWGRLEGMRNTLLDRGWPRWPKADDVCGFFSPDEQWLQQSAFEARWVVTNTKKGIDRMRRVVATREAAQ